MKKVFLLGILFSVLGNALEAHDLGVDPDNVLKDPELIYFNALNGIPKTPNQTNSPKTSPCYPLFQLAPKFEEGYLIPSKKFKGKDQGNASTQMLSHSQKISRQSPRNFSFHSSRAGWKFKLKENLEPELPSTSLLSNLNRMFPTYKDHPIKRKFFKFPFSIKHIEFIINPSNSGNFFNVSVFKSVLKTLSQLPELNSLEIKFAPLSLPVTLNEFSEGEEIYNEEYKISNFDSPQSVGSIAQNFKKLELKKLRLIQEITWDGVYPDPETSGFTIQPFLRGVNPQNLKELWVSNAFKQDLDALVKKCYVLEKLTAQVGFNFTDKKSMYIPGVDYQRIKFLHLGSFLDDLEEIKKAFAEMKVKKVKSIVEKLYYQINSNNPEQTLEIFKIIVGNMSKLEVLHILFEEFLEPGELNVNKLIEYFYKTHPLKHKLIIQGLDCRPKNLELEESSIEDPYRAREENRKKVLNKLKEIKEKYPGFDFDLENRGYSPLGDPYFIDPFIDFRRECLRQLQN